MSLTEKILTLHPAGKNGVNISIEKYTIIYEFILTIVRQHKTISFKELNQLAVKKLSKSFEGKIPWYIVTVKQDMEARNIIEKIPGSGPQLLRMKK